MMIQKYLFSLLFLSLLSSFLYSQINPEKITIARDKFGVPHIFAKTDPEVAYGLAWATAEDDFKTMQELILPIRGLSGQVFGKDGAMADVGVHLLGAHQIVEERYETDLTEEFKTYLEGFVAGVNAYATRHPKEVLHKKLFPISEKDVIKGYVMGMALLSGVQRDLGSILSGRVQSRKLPVGEGSNAFAISKNKSTDGKTHLVINSHQPLEGLNSWYEAHICSEEGLNIHGGTFAGGASIFVGVNENLGWGHTVNLPDFADTYELTMHPTKKLTYKFDGQWIQLEPYHTKARIKILGFLKIGLKQKFYKSKYGVTFKTDNGFFALRFPANRNIQAAEQWFRMNKASNLEEFMEALKIQGIGCTNIVYADKEDHIFYIGNGRFPKRNPNYNWREVLPGDTSATLWEDEYYGIEDLPQVLDPNAGYVYNCNHTPFLSSGIEDNPLPENIPASIGYQRPEMLTNRADRFWTLINQYHKLSYEDVKRIKYDRAYNKPLNAAPKLEPIFHLNPRKYPELSQSIQLLAEWDRVAVSESEAASTFILALRYLWRKLPSPKYFREGDVLNEAKIVEALHYVQNHLIEHFGKSTVPLKMLQRHIRGDVDLPVTGGPDVLAALSSRMQKDGRLRARAGDGLIEFVRFSEEGVEIETINAFGASAKPESPHYTDQMEMYVNRELKTMTLDKDKVLREAVRTYHPK